MGQYWRGVVTFGSEGTEAGNFCRPWGAAIARYSELQSLFDSCSSFEPTTLANQTTNNVLDSRSTGATNTNTFDTFNTDCWSDSIGIGFNYNAYNGTRSSTSIIGSNNNNNKSINSPAWSTYLIGIADRSNNRIQLFKFDAIEQTVTFLHKFGEGPGARHGQFDRPAGIVFNPKLEQIIVADKDNHRIQVFDMSGSYLFKFGERGSKCGQFCYPWDIDVCKTTHNIVVSDTRNRRVQIFNNLGRYLMHFSQPLDSPRGVTYLSSTQVMVSDFNKHRLLMITSQQNFDDKVVSSSTQNNALISASKFHDNTYQASMNQYHLPPSERLSLNRQHSAVQQLHESKFVGFGEGSSWGEFLRPQGVTCNGSSVFCSDSRNNRVACWNKETSTFNYVNRDVVELDRPAGLAAIDDYIVIVDFGNNRVHICQRQLPVNHYPFDIQVQSKNEQPLWRKVVTFGAEGTEAGNFCRPWGVAIARYSELQSLCDSWSFDTFDNWSESSGVDFNYGSYNGMESIIATNNNRTINSPAWSTYLIGIADRSNNRIQLFKFDAIKQTVTFLHKFGEGPGARHGQFDRPAGIVFNPKLEQIIVADKDNHRIQVFDMSGSYLFKFGERGSKCGQFCYPWDIDVCKTTHNIVVSDTRNRRIQIFNNLGRYLTHFSQPLDSPRGVTYLSSTQVMVSDFNKHRLLMITYQQNFDDKIVSSSTQQHKNSSLISGDNVFLSSINNKYQLVNPSEGFNVVNNRCQQSPATQQLHESKFVGFGEGSSWGEFLRPQGVTCNGSSVFCSDSRNNRVACWNMETSTFNYVNRDVVELDRPAGLAAIDDYIVIVDFGNNRVHICQRLMPL